MRVSEILQLDCRENENMELIQLLLKKMKPFRLYAEDKNVPIKKIEKLVKKLSCKTNVVVNSLFPYVYANDEYIVWKCTLADGNNNYQEIAHIYGCSLYEVMSKIAIVLYSRVKNVRKKNE